MGMALYPVQTVS